jgi:hypothetical protein
MKRLVYLRLFAFVVCVSFRGIPSATAQEVVSQEVKGFELLLEKSESGIYMQGNSGTAWVELSFSLQSGEVRVVDAYGVMQVKSNQPKEDVSNAGFSFEMKRENNRIYLTSLYGTHWKDLSFTLPKNEKLVINEFGVQPFGELF